MATKVRASDPFVGFTFMIEIVGENSGDSIGYFTEVSGLDHRNEVVTHKTVTGSGHEVIQRLPGRYEPGELTLKRGVTRDIMFWDWRRQVVAGKTQDMRRRVTITVMDRAYDPAVVFQFENVWPSRINLGQISAESSDVVVEEVVLQHEGGGLIEVQDAPAVEETEEESTA